MALYKTQFQQTANVLEIVEATIEAEDADQAVASLVAGDFKTYLIIKRVYDDIVLDEGSVKWLKK